MHKKYDDLAAEAKRREDKVAQLTDQLNILRKEAELVKATLADSPQAKVSFEGTGENYILNCLLTQSYYLITGNSSIGKPSRQSHGQIQRSTICTQNLRANH